MLQQRQDHEVSNLQQFTQMHLCNVSAGPLYQVARWAVAQDLLLSGAQPRGHEQRVLEFAQYVPNSSRSYFQALKSILWQGQGTRKTWTATGEPTVAD